MKEVLYFSQKKVLLNPAQWYSVEGLLLLAGGFFWQEVLTSK